MKGETHSRMLPDTFLHGTTPTWPVGSRAGGSQSWAAFDIAQREGPEAERSCCCLLASGTGSWSGRWEQRKAFPGADSPVALLGGMAACAHCIPLLSGEAASLPQDRSISVLTGRVERAA